MGVPFSKALRYGRKRRFGYYTLRLISKIRKALLPGRSLAKAASSAERELRTCEQIGCR